MDDDRDREDAERVAHSSRRSPEQRAPYIHLSRARIRCATLRRSPFRGMKRVIDISGDGPNNQVRRQGHARRVVKQGITINGLPLMTNGGYFGA